MALNELTALESAYHALQPLSGTARRRALQWLSAALDDTIALPEPAAQAAVAVARQAPVARRRGLTSTAVGAKPAQAAKPIKKSAAKVAAKSAAAKAAKPKLIVRGRRGNSRSDAPASNGQRMYRRMPDAEVVMSAYQQTGTVSGLAEHFDVPLHTANHWARQLRKQGYRIGRSH